MMPAKGPKWKVRELQPRFAKVRLVALPDPLAVAVAAPNTDNGITFSSMTEFVRGVGANLNDEKPLHRPSTSGIHSPKREPVAGAPAEVGDPDEEDDDVGSPLPLSFLYSRASLASCRPSFTFGHARARASGVGVMQEDAGDPSRGEGPTAARKPLKPEDGAASLLGNELTVASSLASALKASEAAGRLGLFGAGVGL
jgi:hypothetical protein